MESKPKQDKGTPTNAIGPFPFKHSFPTIDRVFISVKESDLETGQRFDTYTYDGSNLTESHRCHNSGCRYGGISIVNTLKKMMKEEKTEIELSNRCIGEIFSPTGRKTYGPCHRLFSVKVKVVLKYEST